MMRWIVKAAWLVGLAGILAGCTQQCFVTEADWRHYHDLMPACLESDPQAGQPEHVSKNAPTPVTVLDPERRQPWYLSLQEAIALALEKGNTGILSVRNPGQISDDLGSQSQLAQSGTISDSARVLSLEPAIAGASIEAALSRFDVSWTTLAQWRYVDEQSNGFNTFQNGQTAHFETSLAKPLASGGVAGITFQNDYSYLTQVPTFTPTLNPVNVSRLDLTFDQPLLQGFGPEINQLLQRFPFSTPGSSLTGPAQSFLGNRQSTINPPQGAAGFLASNGILITRVRHDQSRAEYERIINYQLLNVEAAYWNLYGAYVNMYASETGMRMAHRVWQIRIAESKVGAKAAGEAERAKGQYELFRGDRIEALNRVLDAERTLRRLLGLPYEDGRQLIPIDAPSLAPYHPDFRVALEEAMNLRPELLIARDELKIRQMDLLLQQNFLLPDLRFTSRYGVSGTGQRLDGSGEIFDAGTGQARSTNAFRNLASTNFNDWNVGLVLNVPLGYRYEHAAVRIARLNLAQAWLSLKNEEERARFYMVKAYRDIEANHELIRIRRAEREGFARTLQDFEAKFKVGALLSGDYEALLQSQRDWVNALQKEYQSIVDYNLALASFQFGKGTIQQHDNVVINDGPLPECAQGRAVEHEHERSAALLVRERARPVHLVGCDGAGLLPMPDLPVNSAPSVAALQAGASANGPLPAARNVAADLAPKASPYSDLPATWSSAPNPVKAAPRPAEVPTDLKPMTPRGGLRAGQVPPQTTGKVADAPTPTPTATDSPRFVVPPPMPTSVLPAVPMSQTTAPTVPATAPITALPAPPAPGNPPPPSAIPRLPDSPLSPASGGGNGPNLH